MSKNFPPFVHALLGLLMLAATFGASVQGAPEPVDPIVGEWLWQSDRSAIFKADGTAHNSDGSDGTWQYLHNPEVQRHYRVVWAHGRYVDEVACSEDGQRGHVRNLKGEQYNVKRAIDDKPAASPTPAPRLVSPATATPKPAIPVPTALPTVGATAADAADPILGEWNWLKGQKVTFQADGTAVANNGGRGTWEFLRNPEPERKYRVTWSPGTYVCDVVYNPATQTGRATNTKGKMFDVTRKTATPDKSEGYFGAPGR